MAFKIKALQAGQLGSVFANNAKRYIPMDSPQQLTAAGLEDSAKGVIAAEAAKKAAKKAKKKNGGLGRIAGTVAGVALAPVTGGASLAVAPALGGAVDSAMNGDPAGAITGLGDAADGAYSAYSKAQAAPTTTPAADQVQTPITKPDGTTGVYTPDTQFRRAGGAPVTTPNAPAPMGSPEAAGNGGSAALAIGAGLAGAAALGARKAAQDKAANPHGDLIGGQVVRTGPGGKLYTDKMLQTDPAAGAEYVEAMAKSEDKIPVEVFNMLPPNIRAYAKKNFRITAPSFGDQLMYNVVRPLAALGQPTAQRNGQDIYLGAR